VEYLDHDRVELWLIKAPAQLDVRRLHKKSVPVQSSSQVSYTDSEQQITYDVRLHRRQLELNNSVLVVPSRNKSSLKAVPATFDGCIDLTLAVDLPVGEHFLAGRTEVTLPDGLRQRFIPFGSVPGPYNPGQPEVPVVPRRSHKKKKRRTRDEGDLEGDLGEFISLDQQSSQEHDVSQPKRRVKQEVISPQKTTNQEREQEPTPKRESPRKNKRKSKSSIGGLDMSSQEQDSSTPAKQRYWESPHPQVSSTAGYDLFAELGNIVVDEKLIQYQADVSTPASAKRAKK
jgi:hypothetical protein